MNLEKFINEIEKHNGQPHDLHDFVIKNIGTLRNAQELLSELARLIRNYACQPKPKPCKGSTCEHRKTL